MNVHIKGRNYEANGEYKDNHITVFAGSRISDKFGKYRHGKRVLNIRENSKYVKDNIVIKDVTFSTPSSAAQFVVGYSVNGLERWKVEKKISLKDYLKGVEK